MRDSKIARQTSEFFVEGPFLPFEDSSCGIHWNTVSYFDRASGETHKLWQVLRSSARRFDVSEGAKNANERPKGQDEQRSNRRIGSRRPCNRLASGGVLL